ncbi:SDR family NAD(P)-dependent oxidoreductase [Piscirickettsia litoralis]|uniref:Short-chain dehydrogenase/reductase n=1 Tax=Piscirickettsia litoralis TaxID=1891921 RepID=A0ABX3A3R3_9GAMM|nr:SDR family NAD(P)-dependent oxidoreductase [Piscirickettsia litoralis]ODN43502.1 short-chain dehydrogenase/reductase [Piscirickettsia litoralis]
MMQKIIVITGCSKKEGVGYNLALELLKQGHKVIATVRNVETSELQQSHLPRNGNNLDLRQLDLCDDTSTQTFISNVLADYSYIDVLVNNAANVVIGPVESASQEDINTTFQTKVFGPLALIKGFVPAMRERRSGTITTTGSVFCTMPFIMPGIAVYLSALQALERIQESLAIELAPWGINVFNFHPGPIQTTLSCFDGSRKEITEQFYKNFTSHAYQWFDDNTVWQSAADVAKIFSEAILSKSPDFHTYSNEFGRQFAAKNQSDLSANSYRDQFINYLTSLDYTSDDWKI